MTVSREQAKRYLWTLARLGVTGGLLWYISGKIDFGQALRLILGAHPGWAALAVGMIMAQLFVIALRWRYLARMTGPAPGYPLFARFTVEGMFFNQALPSSVGGDAVRMYRLARCPGIGTTRAISSVLLDRAFGLLGIVVIAGIFLVPFVGLVTDPTPKNGAILLVAAGAGGFALFLALDLLPQSLRRWKVVTEFLNMSRQARRVFQEPLQMMRIGITTVVGQMIALSSLYVLALALNVEVSYAMTMAVLPITTLIATVPITIAGWGLREGVMVMALSYAAVPEAQALALSVMYGLALLAAGLPGGAIWLLSRQRPLPDHEQATVPAKD